MASRSKVAVAAVLTLSAAAACSTSSGPKQSPEEKAVRAAYTNYWSAWIAASAKDDSNAPALLAAVKGDQLVRLQANLVAAAGRGQHAQGSVQHDIKQVAVTGQRATLVDCVDVTGWLLYDATGKPVADQLVQRPRQLGAYVLALDGAAWVVTESTVSGSC